MDSQRENAWPEIRAIVANMQDAWNAGDGQGFARDFAEDADFVNVRGDHHQGKGAIAAGHQGIFDTIYKGSHNQYDLIQARQIAPNVVVAHVASILDCPSGPLTGRNEATFSMVLLQTGSGYEVVSFHNTLKPK